LLAAQGEKVTLDGSDPVTGSWTRHADDIYRIEIDGPIEQVFVDGRMQIEARWPNMRLEEIWDRTKWARSDFGSRKDLMICELLAETGIDWTGALATLNVGHQYKTWTRDVKQHSIGSDQFTYELDERLGDGSESGPSWADDCFFLSGKLEALDTPTEWFHDAGRGILYLRCDDGGSPATRQVAIKRRVYAIDASRCQYIQIIGLSFFAATLRLDQCEHCLVDQCRLQFPVYTKRFNQRSPEGSIIPEPATLVAGDYNTIRNTSISFSNLGGLLVRGKHCRVEDCIIHDVNWVGNYGYPGISLQGSSAEENHNVVSHCTVHGVGNIGILYSGRANTIEYNHVFGTGRSCRDIAAIHTGGVRAMGSVAHHNWVHDSTGIGLRGDDQTRGLTFHHNVVWNCRRGMIIKGNHNKVYHNTVLVDPESNGSTASIVIPKRAEPQKWWTRNPTLPVQNEDTLVFNNASYSIADRGGTPIPASDRVSHNVILSGDARSTFRDAREASLADGTFDLRPLAGSSLIDAGRLAPEASDAYHGNAPDAGAYESQGERWIAGAKWLEEPTGIQLVVRLEPPLPHPSIPLPGRLQESDISRKGLGKLQELYDQLWAEDDRASNRAKAIALRERYPENSSERAEHHATVAQLHREVWLMLRDRGRTVLGDEDRAAYDKAVNGK
jgi:hypothetical protein